MGRRLKKFPRGAGRPLPLFSPPREGLKSRTKNSGNAFQQRLKNHRVIFGRDTLRYNDSRGRRRASKWLSANGIVQFEAYYSSSMWTWKMCCNIWGEERERERERSNYRWSNYGNVLFKMVARIMVRRGIEDWTEFTFFSRCVADDRWFDNW